MQRGQKVSKTVYSVKYDAGLTPYNATDVTDYLGGYQYTNTELSFFPTSEGYVNNVVSGGNNNFTYVYNYTDHLGNIRLSYSRNTDGTLKYIEENHYYPFGLKHENYNSEVSSIMAPEESMIARVYNPSQPISILLYLRVQLMPSP